MSVSFVKVGAGVAAAPAAGWQTMTAAAHALPPGSKPQQRSAPALTAVVHAEHASSLSGLGPPPTHHRTRK
jgi:hypothetical protein